MKKTYGVSCCKALYCCLEYYVPIGHMYPVIEGVLRELACFKISSLPDPSIHSYCAYELGVFSYLQVGEVMYNGKDILGLNYCELMKYIQVLQHHFLHHIL